MFDTRQPPDLLFLTLDQQVRILVLIVKLKRSNNHDNTKCFEDNERKVMDVEGSWQSVIFGRTYGKG